MSEIDWRGLEQAQADSAFGSESCLTVYLSGAPENHLRMRPDLLSLNAIGLEGEESGFVYAKVPVALTRQDIEDKISRVRQAAQDADVEIGVIDLDSNPEIQRTKFHTLWTPS